MPFKFAESENFNNDTASTSYGNADEGMFNVTEINEGVIIGESLRAIKMGKLQRTIDITNGDTFDIILPDYKNVPDSNVNLLSIIKALDHGWRIAKSGVR